MQPQGGRGSEIHDDEEEGINLHAMQSLVHRLFLALALLHINSHGSFSKILLSNSEPLLLESLRSFFSFLPVLICLLISSSPTFLGSLRFLFFGFFF